MSFQYCGGIPEIPKADMCELVVSPKGFQVIQAFKKNVIIPIGSIKNVSMKTDEQISSDVTLTRVLLLGIFALGAKKKTKQITNYLVIEYESNGLMCTAIFTGDKVAKLYSDIAKIRQEYLKRNPPAPAAPTVVDPASEIERFHALMEKGIITQEEFAAKKSQLLGI